MGAKEFASLLGGLALFLYGMNMMSQGIEAAAGNKMKQILERLTTNPVSRCFSRSSDHCDHTVILRDNSQGCRFC